VGAGPLTDDNFPAAQGITGKKAHFTLTICHNFPLFQLLAPKSDGARQRKFSPKCAL
jgi:hypothetical protein